MNLDLTYYQGSHKSKMSIFLKIKKDLTKVKSLIWVVCGHDSTIVDK